MKVTDIRRERLRDLMEKKGVTNLAAELGYRQPSFLSQMAGPNPTREVTEKTARNYEKKLGMEVGSLDTPLSKPTLAQEVQVAVDEAAAGNVALVADVIRLVGSICSGEKVELPPLKFADVVALAYVDTMEHNRTPRPEHIKQIVRLLK